METFQPIYPLTTGLSNKTVQKAQTAAFEMYREEEYLPESVQKLLEVMEYDVPYTSNDLMEKMGLKAKEGFRRNYLHPAIEMNLIQMTLPDKPNSRNQRYVRIG